MKGSIPSSPADKSQASRKPDHTEIVSDIYWDWALGLGPVTSVLLWSQGVGYGVYAGNRKGDLENLLNTLCIWVLGTHGLVSVPTSSMGIRRPECAYCGGYEIHTMVFILLRIEILHDIIYGLRLMVV